MAGIISIPELPPWIGGSKDHQKKSDKQKREDKAVEDTETAIRAYNDADSPGARRAALQRVQESGLNVASLGNAVPQGHWLENVSPGDLTAIKNNYERLSGQRFGTMAEFIKAVETPNPQARLAYVQSVTETGSGESNAIVQFPSNNRKTMPDGSQDPLLTRFGNPAQAELSDISSAIEDSPGFSPYVRETILAAQRHNVPWQLVYGIIRAESDWNPSAVGDHGQSHGLAQIYMPANPGWTPAMARDPKRAIEETARRLAEHYYNTETTDGSGLRNWELAVLAHNCPACARTLYESGQSMSGRGPADQSYISRVFGGEGSGHNPLTSMGFDGTIIGLPNEGAGAAGSAITLPDRVSVKQSAEDYIRQWFLREPVPGEAEKLTDFVVDQITSTAMNNRKGQEVNNPYRQFAGTERDPGSYKAGGVPMVNPLAGGQGKVSNNFGQDRGDHRHAGVDISAPEDTPIVATVGGTIARAELTSGGYGNLVVLKGDDGREYRYAHLNAIGVKVGQRVEQGTNLGLSGGRAGAPGAGNSKGPHLHFEIRVAGQAIDPYPSVTGSTSVAGGAVDPENVTFDESVDGDSRILEAIRNSNEYQKLYGQKPDYLSEEEYQGQFRDLATTNFGDLPSNEQLRVGLEGGNLSTFAGYMAGAEGEESPTFRGRMFDFASKLNDLL